MTNEEKLILALVGVGSAGFSYLAGKAIGNKEGYDKADFWWKTNTPEEQLKALEEAKCAKEEAASIAREAERKNQDAYARLVATKKEYQDEIRPEIEASLRKELATYISEADSKYAKAEESLQEAKRENEMSRLRLELMSEYKKDSSRIPSSSSGIGYGDAIVAISSSTMSPYDKKEAIEDLEVEKDSDYYKAAIGIAKSNMGSYDRLQAIRSL